MIAIATAVDCWKCLSPGRVWPALRGKLCQLRTDKIIPASELRDQDKLQIPLVSRWAFSTDAVSVSRKIVFLCV